MYRFDLNELSDSTCIYKKTIFGFQGLKKRSPIMLS